MAIPTKLRLGLFQIHRICLRHGMHCHSRISVNWTVGHAFRTRSSPHCHTVNYSFALTIAPSSRRPILKVSHTKGD